MVPPRLLADGGGDDVGDGLAIESLLGGQRLVEATAEREDVGSLGLSTGFPRACSGLMHEAVPMMMPSAVPLVGVGD